jgi:hypothetical protein
MANGVMCRARQYSLLHRSSKRNWDIRETSAALTINISQADNLWPDPNVKNWAHLGWKFWSLWPQIFILGEGRCCAVHPCGFHFLLRQGWGSKNCKAWTMNGRVLSKWGHQLGNRNKPTDYYTHPDHFLVCWIRIRVSRVAMIRTHL